MHHSLSVWLSVANDGSCHVQVVHPAPGNAQGTLVNAILNHCSLPNVGLPDTGWLSAAEDVSEEDLQIDAVLIDRVSNKETSSSSSIRPGIVHRLDKGTSGLLVVAKVRLSPFPLPLTSLWKTGWEGTNSGDAGKHGML